MLAFLHLAWERRECCSDWHRLNAGETVLVGGWVDTSDDVDVYSLGSPWTGFFNYVFSTGGASMPVSNEGLGTRLGGYLTDNLYAIAGFADSNSDPADSIDRLFDEQQYFSHFDLG